MKHHLTLYVLCSWNSVGCTCTMCQYRKSPRSWLGSSSPFVIVSPRFRPLHCVPCVYCMGRNSTHVKVTYAIVCFLLNTSCSVSYIPTESVMHWPNISLINFIFEHKPGCPCRKIWTAVSETIFVVHGGYLRFISLVRQVIFVAFRNTLLALQAVWNKNNPWIKMP